ncbi:MAG TPA: RNA polymerase sigma factor [Gammaproteobacteria bacterium]|nr:RNA polymerase sigma factor [Gammaproteobacteria bacterium]
MANITHFWARFRQGQQKAGAFENAVRPHIRPLYRLAVHYCGNHHEAEELLQELLYRLYSRQQEVLAVEKLRPWLARVLYNLFVDRFRREQLRPASFSEMGWEDEGAAENDLASLQTEELPERDFEQRLTREHLESCLQRLPPPQRLLLVMHDVEEYTLQELEIILETPLGTLKSRLHRARERLRGILLEEEK